MNSYTNCPACLRLPEWQWYVWAEADDFCREHHAYRYEELIITDDEWYLAWLAASFAADASYAPGLCLSDWLPVRRHRCTSCGEEWLGKRWDHLECQWLWDKNYRSYTPLTPSDWDDDSFALPDHQGMGRRSI